MMRRVWTGLLAGAAFTFAAPAIADVKTGVDAWTQGDYAKAVAEWRPLAEKGDPDAQFNLGQAYVLGRGVAADSSVALEWFRKAAAQGHPQAEDNYGRLLFQQGKRAEAMPWIQKSADRGEPRAQYLLGTALFNGEFVGKDWVRAYALMTRAAAAGIPPASTSLAQMNLFIPADQRQQGTAMAAELAQRPQTAAVATVSQPAPAKPVRTAEAAPAKPVPAAAKPELAKPAAPPAKAPEPAPAKKPEPAKADEWRVQLGAFSEAGRADALWKSLSGKVSGLSGYRSYQVKGGAVTRLQAGPLSSQADAEKLCKTIKAAGTDCLIKKM